MAIGFTKIYYFIMEIAKVSFIMAKYKGEALNKVVKIEAVMVVKMEAARGIAIMEIVIKAIIIMVNIEGDIVKGIDLLIIVPVVRDIKDTVK